MTKELQEIIMSELNHIRLDIAGLKKCQIQYFTLSITGTAGLLSLYKTMNITSELSFIIFLAPLIIILPCWWIFFDKAHTISRNTGYIQIVEEILTDERNAKYFYYGFERALCILRCNNNEDTAIKMLKHPKSYYWNLIFTKHRFRYWMLNWAVFFSLSFICITASCYKLYTHTGITSNFSFILALVLLVVTLIIHKTIRIAKKLILGCYSYNCYYKIWKIILSYPKVKNCSEDIIKFPF